MDDLTPSEQKILDRIAHHGPQTTRLLVRLSPKPNWMRLLTRRILVEHHTAYGRVIAPSRATYDAYRQAGKVMPYLLAPGSAADRAFQWDATMLLQAQGYRVWHAEFKHARQGGGQRTHQVLHFIMQTPQAIREEWAAPTFKHFWSQEKGYPYLYASVANGGIKISQLRALVRRHDMDRIAWRHPLIIAVPDAEPLRAYHRQLEAKDERRMLHIIELRPPPEGQ